MTFDDSFVSLRGVVFVKACASVRESQSHENDPSPEFPSLNSQFLFRDPYSQRLLGI